MGIKEHNWEVIGAIERFQKIYSGLEFMDIFPKDKKFRMVVRTNDPLEMLKIKWWLRFPPKKPKRNWYPE